MLIKYLTTTLFLFISYFSFGQAAKNFLDQAYLETRATVDTVVIPDVINISIKLKEDEGKGKKSTEELENILQKTLTKIGVDTKKSLTLLDYGSNFKSAFLKSTDIIKTKNYQLKVDNAQTAGLVLAELEKEGISNVDIQSTEYSKKAELYNELRVKAIIKAKKSAEILTKALDQKIGKAIHIIDNINESANTEVLNSIRIRGSSSLKEESIKPIDIDFKPIKFNCSVSVKFLLY